VSTFKLSVMALILVRLITPFQAEAGDGFYAGASIGSANLDDDFDGFEVDDDTTAYRLIGGWWVNRYFALEAGYQNFGDFEQDFSINGELQQAKLSADGYTLGVQGSYPLANRISVYGRAGWFFWDGEAEVNNVTQASPEDSNPYLGLGLSYDITDSFSVNSDWSRYELESANSDVFSIGFQFRFGK
jgi:OOP family OmpA-OmpF porin